MITKHKIGKDLKYILDKQWDIVQISRWSENIYTNHCRELSPEIDDIIMALSCMEHGPEFEYTEEELRLFAEKLINDEDMEII